MAEGYLRKFLPDATIWSAGVESHGLNRLAVQVMAEDNIDISQHASKTIDALPPIEWDVVITVCDNARERCPVLPGRHHKIHRAFSDPAAAKGADEVVLPEYRRVRDEIRAFALEFAKTDTLLSTHR